MGIKSTRTVNVPADPNTDTFTGSVVSGDWSGGSYVNLAFGGYSQPIEVINVWNYETSTPDPRVHTPAGLKEIIREWIKANDEGWPEWYGVYVEQYHF